LSTSTDSIKKHSTRQRQSRKTPCRHKRQSSKRRLPNSFLCRQYATVTMWSSRLHPFYAADFGKSTLEGHKSPHSADRLKSFQDEGFFWGRILLSLLYNIAKHNNHLFYFLLLLLLFFALLFVSLCFHIFFVSSLLFSFFFSFFIIQIRHVSNLIFYILSLYIICTHNTLLTLFNSDNNHISCRFSANCNFSILISNLRS